jgi:nucleoside-diphosphate-sugar epimerase
MSVEAVKVGGIDRWLHTHERASRDLGYQPRSLADGLPETVAWAIKDGKP